MTEMMGGIGDTILDGLQAILYATIYKLLYYLAVGCCWVINILYSMFEVMVGLSKVSYDGDFDYLINIFFSNTSVSKVYWGMALIGLAVGFAFAIAAVIKKIFDTSEKQKRSFGQILGSLFKSSLTIVCMSLIVTMVLNATTLLMQQINYVFIHSEDLGEAQTITYTDEEYAAMARALNTIGNFSLNPSYNNRFNLNKCFNEIRLDLQYLKQQGVFEAHYLTTDVQGNTIATWQSALQRIANSSSLDRDLSMDVYHESVSKSILEAMELLKVNGSFKPLEQYQRHYQPTRSSLPMDRFLFLMATLRAAKNVDYNTNPSLTDPLRGAYYFGEKSIYDLETVNEDFDIGIAAFDYLVLFLTCLKMLQILVTIILNCVARIFNMLLLYLISPLIVSVSPLDDGGKFKQWTTAFVVQSFSVFGTVISMRVLLLFMPVVLDSNLVIITNPVGNFLAKLVIVLGAFEVSEKATSLITGILADNAGWQSITAGDMSGTSRSALEKGKGILKTGAKVGLKVGGGAALLGGYGAYYGAKGAYGAGKLAAYGTGKAVAWGAGKAAAAGGSVLAASGRAIWSGGSALASKISEWRNSGRSDETAGGGTAVDSTGFQTSSQTTGQMPPQTQTVPQSQHEALTSTPVSVGGPTTVGSPSLNPSIMSTAGGTHTPLGSTQPQAPGQTTTQTQTTGKTTKKTVKQTPKSLRSEIN